MKQRLRDVIGCAMIGAFIGALFAMFWKAIPEGNSDVITYMIGQLSGFAATIVAYHYATNVQSQQATENTGKAFEAVKAAAEAGTTPTGPSGEQGDPVHVTEEQR